VIQILLQEKRTIRMNKYTWDKNIIWLLNNDYTAFSSWVEYANDF